MAQYLSRGRCSFSLLIAVVVLVTGCPSALPPAPSNQSPIADAGDAQTVNGGVRVILDGLGSSDPDGDDLTYEWTQVAGQTVTLAGSATAQPSFAAPNQELTLRFLVTVTDEAGASSTDSVNVVINAVDNVPPVAWAQSEETAPGGSVVLLDGSGSSDGDGDPLTYAWVQTAGTSVTLTDADRALASFTASSEDEELVFELTVDDGNGHTDTDSITITVERVPPNLFITNVSGNSAILIVDPASKDGNVAPDGSLSNAEALLDAPTDVLLPGDSSLIVLNRGSNSLNLYLDATTSSDDQAPLFIVQGAATLLDQPTTMAHDPDSGLLYVANTGASNDILVFPDPTAVVFDGNLAPLRVISSAALSLPAGIALDNDDRLYVANTGSNNVLVFDNASERDGDILPDRSIDSDLLTDPLDVLVDDSDTLYVVDSSGVVLMFSNASALDGDSTPTSTLSVTGAQRIVRMAVDTAGVGYIVDSEASAIYVFDDVGSVSGDRTPDRTISGDETELNRPLGVFILE